MTHKDRNKLIKIYLHTCIIYNIHVHTYGIIQDLQTRISQQPDVIETSSFHCWKAQVLFYLDTFHAGQIFFFLAAQRTRPRTRNKTLFFPGLTGFFHYYGINGKEMSCIFDKTKYYKKQQTTNNNTLTLSAKRTTDKDTLNKKH